MLRAALVSWVDAVGLSVDDAAWSRLDALVLLWQRYGPALNLLGAYDSASLIEHVREGLAARRVAELAASPQASARWIDVGSGGGLPGLVVAATTPWPMLLVEPRAKRAAFLDLACATISGRTARVARARIDDPTWDQNTEISKILGSDSAPIIASARAVFAPAAWLDLARRTLPSRAIILVHVAQEVAAVAGEPPTWRVDAGRWAVLAYPASSPP